MGWYGNIVLFLRLKIERIFSSRIKLWCKEARTKPQRRPAKPFGGLFLKIGAVLCAVVRLPPMSIGFEQVQKRFLRKKEGLLEYGTVTVFGKDEVKWFREEVFTIRSNEKRKHQQAAAYTDTKNRHKSR